MEINLKNGAVEVTTGGVYARRIQVSTHARGRSATVSARHWPGTEDTGESYICMSLEALEHSHEAPLEEAHRKPATAQTTFMDIDTAREMRDALTIAIDCADVK